MIEITKGLSILMAISSDPQTERFMNRWFSDPMLILWGFMPFIILPMLFIWMPQAEFESILSKRIWEISCLVIMFVSLFATLFFGVREERKQQRERAS